MNQAAAAMSIIPADDDGFGVIENSASHIRGKMLKFKDDSYLIDKTEQGNRVKKSVTKD